MAVIDFHSHILPGIDDGSKNVQMSLEMLKRASEQGVDVMLATSHFYASRHRMVVSNTTCFFVSKYNKNLDFKGNLQ